VINAKVEKAINEQINAELYSAYLYLAMAAHFEAESLDGFANWMRVQFQEELEHAMRFYDYLVERGGRVSLLALEEPPQEWESPLSAFEEAYKHECYISGRIDDLMDLAIGERDHASASMLQWFVDEQVEEEASTDEIVQKLRLVGDNSGGLFMLDRELVQRQFTPQPTAEEEG